MDGDYEYELLGQTIADILPRGGLKRKEVI
jgi:hypothetical protein